MKEICEICGETKKTVGDMIKHLKSHRKEELVKFGFRSLVKEHLE